MQKYRIKPYEANQCKVYLSHYDVIRELSIATKLRVVFVVWFRQNHTRNFIKQLMNN